VPATSPTSGSPLADLASAVVAAYVTNNSVPAADLPDLIVRVHGALAALAAGGAPAEIEVATPDPIAKPTASEIRRSVRPDGIMSFIDGRSYKTLKRHLTAHGLHPHSYRERYGLPADYPMVASSYAERRSALAKQIGLGLAGGLIGRERPGRAAA
jgi:predicted transcriptional regulator